MSENKLRVIQGTNVLTDANAQKLTTYDNTCIIVDKLGGIYLGNRPSSPYILADKNAKNITYSELVSIKNNSKLIEGSYYRITDYNTTTTQENTISANHPFDIVVVALSNNELSEEAYAIQSDRDIERYFANSNLQAWKLWYSLDNDTNRFAWADTVNGKGVIYRMIDEWDNDCPYDFKNILFTRKKLAPIESDDEGSSGGISPGSNAAYVKDQVNGFITSGLLPFVYGCITADVLSDHAFYYIIYEGSSENFYTFSNVIDGVVTDKSNTLYCYSNHIKPYINTSVGEQRYLNNNVFFSFNAASYTDNNILGANCYENSFGNLCKSNTFGDYCNNNCIGNTFTTNKLGNSCDNNLFGNACDNNSFGHSNKSFLLAGSNDINSFGNENYANIFGTSTKANAMNNNCYHNKLGNSCDFNVFDNNCNNNTIGGSADYNKFDNGASYNTMGTSCKYNHFGNDTTHNTLGNNCLSNDFGNSVQYNVIGNAGQNNNFGANCQYNNLGAGCQNNNFGANCQYNSIRRRANNTAALQAYCNNITFGESCSYNTLYHSTIASSTKFIQNITIKKGVSGSESAYNFIDLSHIEMNNEQSIEIGQVNNTIYFGHIIPITYNELVSLRDTFGLIPGYKYRITDYVTTTTQEGTLSAGHLFDIIVEATSNNTLSEEAKAVYHEGDTYFNANGANLDAWKLWYCLDNDESKFAWVDVDNGKGVIYRMIDEWNNDCPYDFKNIKFRNPMDEDDLNHYYTFNGISDGQHYDLSVVQEIQISDINPNYSYHIEPCSNNTIKPFYINHLSDSSQTLNSIIFVYNQIDDAAGDYSDTEEMANIHSNYFSLNCRNMIFEGHCHHNTFGNSCYSNSFGYSCYSNSFGYNCYSNSFGYSCYSNSFGNNCYSNSFGDHCYSNSFGDHCYSNSFEDRCYYNSFGDDCGFNSFGDGGYSNSFGRGCGPNSFGRSCGLNTFGASCGNNTFGTYCSNNTFGNNCDLNTFGYNCQRNTFGNLCGQNTFGDQCDSNTFGNNCKKNSLITYTKYSGFYNQCNNISLTTQKTVGSSYSLQYINIASGINNVTIDSIEPGLNYETKVAKNSQGEIKIYCEADLIA